ncbi:hypothetical protein HYN48_13895 [Flavobacterium magnum]|uniref:Uncharacterized protein n=1 Tax=Flavobacterium magnum TaxID=2162713 RepID=A0A2S0RIY7_9FLAO|nr:DUF5412 family protein [Flavobacterium magnum]AWA30989.1 hypothetical protein HYN48_13365 [Flavobacterium magnum]AWA31091.1 hypothetical protein HYN48_13895 [Flavobacterium magnum]
MKKALKIVLIMITLVIIGFIAFWALVFYDMNPCGNKVASTFFSPNKQFKILVFERNCGATTDFSTQVSLLRHNLELEHDDEGNIFSADRNYGDAEIDENGNVYLKATWLNNNKVLITYDSKIRIFKKENKLDGITILYNKNYR